LKRLLTLAGSIGLIHGLEDICLLTMGRFLPVPIWAMYAIGLSVSMILMTIIIDRLTRRT
jgi:hypothetical protein